MKKSRTTKPSTAKLKPARPPRELAAAAADVAFQRGALKAFGTTQEIAPLTEIIGQDRAMQALAVGLGIGQEGYNIFVAGLTGSGKMETIRRSLQQRLRGSKVPDDWVYVHNFDEPDEPRSMRLRAGQGKQLKKDLDWLVERLRAELPKAFRKEDFTHEKEQLAEKYQGQFQKQMQQLVDRARERGFELREGSDGTLVFLPLINGKPPENEAQLQALPAAERERLSQEQRELTKAAERIFRNRNELLGSMSEEVHAAERRFGGGIIAPLFAKLKAAYADNAAVTEYLDAVQRHTLEHLADFRQSGTRPLLQMAAPGLLMMGEQEPRFVEYEVNVVVDHSATDGAPVIVEDYPTYRNLFGTIERTVEPTGRVTTNFTQIKSGSLLRASGGYLVFNLEDALTEPFVYKNLKRVLKTGHLRFETYDPFGLFSTVGLRPRSIPLATKVVVFGSPWLYLLLRFYDEEFASIFKVKAEFGTEMPRGANEQWLYARFVAMLAQEEKLRPFQRAAVIEVIRFGARRAAQQNKLLTRFSEVADLLREADHCAGQDQAPAVSGAHVRQALHRRIYRSDRIAEKIRELIADGTLLIDTAGRRPGQVNGLAIVDLGDYAFGKPSRVTASIGLGSEGVINIEREAKLSGSTHDKGMLILTGYLRHKYGQDKPLALTASICFEQSYGGVDGDSASSTELYALLSSIAGVPLRQDITVTGSINQWGEIQAIGGVNEKIEGYFEVCRELGLTGQQGVCLPASNVRNLVLRDDVLAAIRQKKFHLYPIKTVDAGLELLTGIKAGTPTEPATLHWLVDQRLRRMAEDLRDFSVPRPLPGAPGAKQEIPPHIPPKLPEDNP